MHSLPIHTPSLVLRHLVPEDAPVMMELNAEPTTRAWLPSHVYESPAEALARIGYLIARYASHGGPKAGPYVLGVARRDNGELLGHVGFSPLDDDVEVSYAIAERARGRGYGTEALSHACAWATRTFAFDEVLAVTASANEASRRVLVRASFVHASDEVMKFQGTDQVVSRYVWRRAIVRQATVADIAGIQRVRHSVRENRLVSTTISDEDVRVAIEETGRGWVIAARGEVVAFAVGNAANGNIWALFVHPDHERRGHGRALHDTMIEWLFAKGLPRLWLTTEPGTRAQSFYEAAGWQLVGPVARGELRYERGAP